MDIDVSKARPKKPRASKHKEKAHESELMGEEDLSPAHYKVNNSGKFRPATTDEIAQIRNRNMIDPNDLNLDEIPELHVIDADTEVKVKVVGVRKGTDKRGYDYYMLTLDAIEFPNSKDFTTMLTVPDKQKMRLKEFALSGTNWKNFLLATEFSSSGPYDPTNEWLELEAWAILGIRENAEYGKQNFIQRWVSVK